MADGMHVYDNPVGVLTNNPPFPYQMAALNNYSCLLYTSYIFVNGTGVGMKPLEGMSVVPDKSFFRPELIVIDVPYSPLETSLYFK